MQRVGNDNRSPYMTQNFKATTVNTVQVNNSAFANNRRGEWQEDGKNISRSVCTIFTLSIESLPRQFMRMRAQLEERAF